MYTKDGDSGGTDEKVTKRDGL